MSTTGPITLNATASSGLPVSYAITSGPTTVSGNVLSLDGIAGVVTIEATQDGNTTFEAATPVSISFTVNLPACDTEIPQNVTIGAITDNTATIQWDATNGVSYEVRFRESV